MSAPVIVVALRLPCAPMVGVTCGVLATPIVSPAAEGSLPTTDLAVTLVKRKDQQALGIASGPPLDSQNASVAEEDRHDIVVTSQRIVFGDPFQKINAKSFAVTQEVDKALGDPVSLAYRRSIPEPIRNGFTNFVTNHH